MSGRSVSPCVFSLFMHRCWLSSLSISLLFRPLSYACSFALHILRDNTVGVCVCASSLMPFIPFLHTRTKNKESTTPSECCNLNMFVPS